MARPNRRAEITQYLALRESQGLTYAELSRHTGISVSAFTWWSRRLRDEAEEEQELFAQVSVVEEPSTPVIASGVSIRVQDLVLDVEPGFDAETLAGILAVIRKSRC